VRPLLSAPLAGYYADFILGGGVHAAQFLVAQLIGLASFFRPAFPEKEGPARARGVVGKVPPVLAALGWLFFVIPSKPGVF